jgi:hypothetical protein
MFERLKRKDDRGIFVEWKGEQTAAYLESIKMQPEMFEGLRG